MAVVDVSDTASASVVVLDCTNAAVEKGVFDTVDPVCLVELVIITGGTVGIEMSVRFSTN